MEARSHAPVQMPRWKVWFMATRPWSLTISVIPILLATVLAWTYSNVSITFGVLMLLTSISTHIACNLTNDYFDHIHGVDAQQLLGVVDRRVARTDGPTLASGRTIASARVVPSAPVSDEGDRAVGILHDRAGAGAAGKDEELGGMPNGIAFSPDEKYLYVNADYSAIMRYDVEPDGSLSNGMTFIDGEGSDGIKVDKLGNVYTTTGAGPGDVRITSPDGVRIGTIKLPVFNREPQAQICATNIAFGDSDSKGLYITACEHVYRIQMKVAGVRPQ